MEEFDDLVPTPDDDGKLELKYRGWQSVDEVIWTMGREILSLNLAYNKIAQLPPELGDLQLVQELDLSCNKLRGLPREIGKLKMLKYLKLNGNSIEALPDELGSCSRLQTLLCGENRLATVPPSVHKLKELRVLQLCNNTLDKLPASICTISTLKEVDVANNPGIDYMVPPELQSNTHFVLWMCKVYFDYENEVALIDTVDEGYQTMMTQSGRRGDDLVESVEKLNDDNFDLQDDFPRGCEARCARCYYGCRCHYCCNCGSSCSVM